MVRIAIVDDAAFARTMLKDIVVDSGFEFAAEGSDGIQAVELYERIKPDLLILDVVMPLMDGFSALAIIMKMDPQAKVIMCSAAGQRTIVIDAIQAGAKDYIVKPFSRDRVLESICRVLQI